MDCSICQFLRDELIAIEHAEHYPYPRTREHRKGVENLAIRHYRTAHQNPFRHEEEFMKEYS